MTDTNRVQIAAVTEVTPGTTPSANLQILRITGESLKLDTQSARSNEIRSDRQDPAVVRQSLAGGGSINFEMSYGAHDLVWPKALQSAGYSTARQNTGTYSVSGSNLTGTGVHTNINVGEWVRVMDGATLHGIFKVTAVATDQLTLRPTPGALTGDGDEVVEHDGQIVNGTTVNYLSIERAYTNLASTFAAFRGYTPNEASLNIAAGEFVTGSFSFLGLSGDVSETATIGTGYDAAPTAYVANAVDNAYRIEEGGAAYTITGLTLQTSNNLAARNVVGQADPESIRSGSFTASGTLNAFFKAADAAVFDRYRDWDDAEIAAIVRDAAGNVTVVEFPAVKYTDAQRVAQNKNGDVILEITWEAYMHATEGITMRMAKIDA